MSERLHYFSEATTPVAFDCDDSDIDSDLDDLSRRPISDSDRAKIHARQLQLWSDEARRRRSVQSPSVPASSPHRRPSSTSLHDVPVTSLGPTQSPLSPKITPSDIRARVSADRQQSNLSERARHVPNPRVSRSPSAKNLRIRITPSSSSKSLLSDIESELGQSASAPQSPRALQSAEPKQPAVDCVLNPVARPDRAEKQTLEAPKKNDSNNPIASAKAKSKFAPNAHSANDEDTADSRSALPTRRMSFSRRVMRFSSLKKLLRR